MAPTSTKQWNIVGKNGFDSLKFTDGIEIPKLGDHDVLVNFHYASLNYRDLAIPMVCSELDPQQSLPQFHSLTHPRANTLFPPPMTSFPAPTALAPWSL